MDEDAGIWESEARVLQLCEGKKSMRQLLMLWSLPVDAVKTPQRADIIFCILFTLSVCYSALLAPENKEIFHIKSRWSAVLTGMT